MRWILASTLVWCVACGSSSSPPALRWADDEPSAFALARAEHKGVMIVFTARWSIPSREFERVFVAPSVLPVIAANFVPLRLDVTVDTEAADAQLERYHAGTPTVIFLDADGRELGRFDRLVSVPAFEQRLRPAAAAISP